MNTGQNTIVLMMSHKNSPDLSEHAMVLPQPQATKRCKCSLLKTSKVFLQLPGDLGTSEENVNSCVLYHNTVP